MLGNRLFKKNSDYFILASIVIAVFILTLYFSFYHYHSDPTEYAKCSLCQLKASVLEALPIPTFSTPQIQYSIEVAEPTIAFVSQFFFQSSLERAPPTLLS
jgi:hypothetical protein